MFQFEEIFEYFGSVITLAVHNRWTPVTFFYQMLPESVSAAKFRVRPVFVSLMLLHHARAPSIFFCWLFISPPIMSYQTLLIPTNYVAKRVKSELSVKIYIMF